MAAEAPQRWHVEVFEDADQLARFLNHVGMTREQWVSLNFQALGPSISRYVLTCMLTPEQLEARIEWQAVERIINPPAVAVATGGGH